MAGGNPWGSKGNLSSFSSSSNMIIPFAVPLSPFPRCHLSLSDYLLQWAYQTLLYPRKTIELLAYFGFQNPVALGLRLCPGRNGERRNGKGTCTSGRQVLRAWVLGAMGTGKSTLLKQCQQKGNTLEDEEFPPLGGASPVHEGNSPLVESNSVTESPVIRAVHIGSATSSDNVSSNNISSEKYLILEEMNANQLRAVLHHESKDFITNHLDLIILTFDASDPNSFSYIAGLAVNIFIATLKVYLCIFCVCRRN